MAAYRNKDAKALEAEHFARMAAWRKEFVRGFDEGEIEELQSLSDQVDKLWRLHTEQLGGDHRETEDPLPVWGRDGRFGRGQRHSNAWKDRIRAQGGAERGDADGQPLPAAEAGHGLLVRALVLADPRVGAAAEPAGIPERGEPGC